MLAKFGIKVKVRQVEANVLIDLRNKGEFRPLFDLSGQNPAPTRPAKLCLSIRARC